MGNAVSNFVHDAVNTIKRTVANVFRRIAHPVVRYVVAHPFQALFHVGSIILLLVPGAVTGPLLALAGFRNAGIVGGSIAAGVQSAMGVVQAGGTFATLHSAAMGGYGAARVATAVRGIAVASEVVAGARAGRR